MAIGTTPLFSKISGSVGPVDYRTRRNGKIEIGKKRIPANPQSTEQQNTRNAYGRLHELWQNASWIDKTQYENIAAAYDISPWNAFLMRHLATMRLNPVGYWPFVEGTGNTLHDFTENLNHGTITGATWDTENNFNIPYLYFDGIDDFVDCGNHSSLNISTQFTLLVDLMKNINVKGGTLEKGSFSLGWDLANGLDATLNLRSTGFVVAADHSANDMATPNIYNFMTVSYDESAGPDNMIFCKNGEIKKYRTDTGGLTITASTFKIGRAVGGTFDTKGIITETALFQHSINPTVAAHLYNIHKKFYGDSP